MTLGTSVIQDDKPANLLIIYCRYLDGVHFTMKHPPSTLKKKINNTDKYQLIKCFKFGWVSWLAADRIFQQLDWVSYCEGSQQSDISSKYSQTYHQHFDQTANRKWMISNFGSKQTLNRLCEFEPLLMWKPIWIWHCKVIGFKVLFTPPALLNSITNMFRATKSNAFLKVDLR